jgi:predicted nucleic acid-binding protein
MGTAWLKQSQTPVRSYNEEEKSFAKRLCSAYEIDVGEAEAIILCLSGKYQLFFTDDSDARNVGELYDIEVHGTAGIVARAHSLGLLSYRETKQVMHDLHERSSLYLTERVYRIVMEMIEKG